MNALTQSLDRAYTRWLPATADRIRGTRAYALYQEAHAELALPRGEQRARRRQRLGDLLRAATKVPHYAHQWTEQGVLPDFDDPEGSLQRLPILTKDALKANPQGMILPGTPTKGLPKIQTAGSTGTPLRAWVDPMVPSVVSAAMYLGRDWWGITPGARSVSLWGHSKYLADSLPARVRLAKRHLLDAAMNRRVFPAYDLGPAKLAAFWRLVAQFEPTYLVGYASALAAAADYLRTHRLPRRLRGVLDRLKGVISTGEMLYDVQAEAIRSATGAPVIREYGLCEAGAVAYEHPDGHLYSLSPFYHVELLDSQGLPVAPGEMGRVVITALRGCTVPLIRYDTGDLALEVAQDEQPAGLRRLGPIQGRAYDLLYTADGQARPGVLFTHALKFLDEVERYQIVQHLPGELEIAYTAPAPLARERLAEVRQRLLVAAGGGMALTFQHRPELTQEASGKFRWIKSHVRPAQHS